MCSTERTKTSGYRRILVRAIGTPLKRSAGWTEVYSENRWPKIPASDVISPRRPRWLLAKVPFDVSVFVFAVAQKRALSSRRGTYASSDDTTRRRSPFRFFPRPFWRFSTISFTSDPEYGDRPVYLPYYLLVSRQHSVRKYRNRHTVDHVSS